MNKRAHHALTAAALRDLDPAPKRDLTEAERDRADAVLVRILATPSENAAPAEPHRPRWRRPGRVLVPVGLAGTVAAVAIPALVSGGGSAYASWTPTPEPVTAAQANAAASTCRASLEMPDHGEKVLVAERRGDWTYVLLSGPRAEGTCLVPNELIGRNGPHLEGLAGGWGENPPDAPALAPDRIGGVEGTDGPPPEGGWLTWVYGYVGSEVTGITVHTGQGHDVEATVDHGRFAAWWPAETEPQSAEERAYSYTVTLADDSTRAYPGSL